MISQAEFFKTLVSKNSTDESILSATAASNCKPTKLLEKLTEAERFGQALEVSMKYGLDPSSIWKTWAIRCLKNRNFPAAREKFRHCFARSKPHSGRTSGATSALLGEIVNQLAKMPENKLPLREEVELIMKRDLSEKDPDEVDGFRTISRRLESKKTIYSECLYYLKEYGTATDYVRFFVRHSMWDEAMRTLLDKKNHINKEKFFINDVIMHSMMVGQLDLLVSVWHKIDPEFKRSGEYLRATYKFLSNSQKPNILYFIQSTIGDHIAATSTQLQHIFLSKPYRNYRELYNRISSLRMATDELKTYLRKCSDSSYEDKADLMFAAISTEEAAKQLATFDLQIVITKNFFINEVSGCVNDVNITTHDYDLTWTASIELSDIHSVLMNQIEKLKGERNGQTKTCVKSDDTSPVTLFDKDQDRITFLTALIMIYFDLTCSTYFSKTGLDLADQLIRDYKLDKLNVFRVAARIIIEDESCNISEIVALLLARLKADFIEMSNEALAIAQAEAELAQKSKARARSSRNSRVGAEVSIRKQSLDTTNTMILAQSPELTSTNRALIGSASQRQSIFATGARANKNQARQIQHNQHQQQQSLQTTATVSAFSPPPTSTPTPHTMLAGRKSSQLFQSSHNFGLGLAGTSPTAATMLSFSPTTATRKTTTSHKQQQPSMNWSLSSVTATAAQQQQQQQQSGAIGDDIVGHNGKSTSNAIDFSAASSGGTRNLPSNYTRTTQITTEQSTASPAAAAAATTTTTSFRSTQLLDTGSRANKVLLTAAKQTKSIQERASMLCDLVILDAIGNCREPDYKMELAKLLSDEAKFELYIVLGKLSNAQHLAFQMNRADYVARVAESAKCLDQDHVRTVCQLWLAKHETTIATGD